MFKPILTAEDLPKVGEPLPSNVICKSSDEVLEKAEQEKAEKMAFEMKGCPPFEFALKPHTAFTFIGCLQLAWRHPHLDVKQRMLIEQLVAMLSEHFGKANAETCLQVIRDGWSK